MNELTLIEREQEFVLMQRMGKAFFASGMFADLKMEAQAIVKIMVGKEMGLSAFASITGIHIVMGKPVIGANLIATMIANHPTYNYRILQATNEICEIEFYDSKNKITNKSTAIGTVYFTIKEAAEAGLLAKKDSIWLKYPSDMLFARAISRGARRFAPGIFGGTVAYTPDEMGVEMDEDGVIIKELVAKKLETFPDTNISMAEIIEEIKEVRKEAKQERDGIIPEKPIPGSDEAIIEEIKKTHVISEGGF